MKIISGKGHDGEIEYIVRKSIWLLILYVTKYIILLFILFAVAFLSLRIKTYLSDPNSIYLVNMLGVLVRILLFYVFISAIVYFIKFFYGVEIINETKIYKLNIGIFHMENIAITNISNIQEVRAETNGFLKVIFGVSNVHIIEQRDKEEILHFIDNGQKVTDIISSFKDDLVRGK